MSIEAIIKCDKCSERLLVSSAQLARPEAEQRGWQVAPKGRNTSDKRDYCPTCRAGSRP